MESININSNTWNSWDNPSNFHWLNVSVQLFVRWSLLIQFSSVAQSCPTLCNPMDRSPPGFPVHHQLQESTLKEISPGCSLERLMLKLKLQYFCHLMPRADTWKDPDAGKDWGQEEKGMTEDEIVGWHHRLNGHEFEQTLGVGDIQGGLACCSPWGWKGSDMTERLN